LPGTIESAIPQMKQSQEIREQQPRLARQPEQSQRHPSPLASAANNHTWVKSTQSSLNSLSSVPIGLDLSDQSTRADAASGTTPDGSGDSGPEESALRLQQTRSVGSAEDRARPRRTGEQMPGRHCTTMMITNVPTFLTQGALVALLEDLSVYMRGAFDFFYCPWDPYQDRNLGYAIINFFARSVAAEFDCQWANQPLLPRTHGAKRLRIVPAALQGRAANIRHFSGFSLAHHHDPRFRPLVRTGPNEQLRPMAIAEEILEFCKLQTTEQIGANTCSGYYR
jgi:hypothetical protein